MADIHLPSREAFGAFRQSHVGQEAGSPRLTLSGCPDLRLAAVVARHGGRVDLARKLRNAFGLTLPDGPLRTTAGRLFALGVGPRSWLIGENGGRPDLARRLAAELGGTAAVSDQSDGYAVMRIAGSAARALLGKGLAIDLHPRVFDPTSVAVTTCSHIGITLWQVDDLPTFEIALFRSYAASFSHWLEESAAEFGDRLRPAI